ncbi:MAG: cell division protein FtsZ [Candidatus Saliniplasma sp.]
MNRNRGYKHKEGSSGLDVLVIGVGGGGNNSINRLSRIGVYGAKTIAVNTDKEHLNNIYSDTKMLIGKEHNKGLGAGGDPNVGMECAESAYGGFKKLLDDSELVFITAGMGGGTGTGAAPVIAEIARRQKAMVISIATMPFSVEGNRRNTAIQGVRRLREYSNSMILLENDKLLEVVPDLPMDQAFGIMDSLISELIKSVTEIITLPSLINLDYNDLKSVLGDGGVSTLMIGESSYDEPKKAVKEASENPFLNADYKGAKKALIHVTGGPDLSITKMNTVVDMMTSKLDPRAGVIFGARIDEECRNKIKLMSIVTGLNRKSKNKVKAIS